MAHSKLKKVFNSVATTIRHDFVEHSLIAGAMLGGAAFAGVAITLPVAAAAVAGFLSYEVVKGVHKGLKKDQGPQP